LRGLKTFQATEPHPAKGEMFRSCDHPFQAFQWADYSVKPGQDDRHTIVALYGEVLRWPDGRFIRLRPRQGRRHILGA